jgi:hypothetical protein
VVLFLATGGGAAALAFLVGLAYGRSVFSLLLLAGAGAFIVMAYHATASPGELMHAAANANLLGWLSGTVLAARLRALEWIDALDPQDGVALNPQEAT